MWEGGHVRGREGAVRENVLSSYAGIIRFCFLKQIEVVAGLGRARENG